MIVGTLLDQFEKDSDNKSIIGKLVLISFAKNEATQIPIKIGEFIKKLLECDEIVDINRLFSYNLKFNEERQPFAINVLEYESIFSLIGCIFSDVDAIYQTSYKYAKLWDVRDEYAREDIKYYLRCVREECCVFLYGRSKKLINSYGQNSQSKDHQYFHYHCTKDLNNLFDVICKRYLKE